MNRVMDRSNRQRGATLNGKPPDQQKPPTWRLFQLAFILLNLDGLVDPAHPDRPIVDLLFFPTGGGKTEAYLGLAAFAIARRRLNNPGLAGAGLSVVMRYTLRLLTLDQLQRAAGLVCALELERKALGQARDLADRNRPLGRRRRDAQQSRQREEPEGKHRGLLAEPVPQGERAGAGAAQRLPLVRDRVQEETASGCSRRAATPQRLDIRCDNVDCAFSSGDRLPIVVVDEEIYRRLPAFMIATIDKFANVPWEGRSGAFFGHVERNDQTGFYGAAESGGGSPLQSELRPIDLIIQDELHLISGPLGTIAGLYETAFDLLASRSDQRGTARAEDRRFDGHGPQSGKADSQPVRSRANRDLSPARRRTDQLVLRRRSTARPHRGFMSASPRRGADRSSSSFAPCRRCWPGAAALSTERQETIRPIPI